MNAPPLHVLTHLPEQILGRVLEAYPNVTLERVPEEGPVPDGVRGDVLLTQAWGSPNLADVLARGVSWVHAYGTGVDAFPFDVLEGRPLTCSRGASAVPIAEWILATLLAAEKRLPDTWLSAPPKRWSFRRLGTLEGRTLGLVGLGAIAQATARRALAFDMRVIAHRRRDLPSPVPGVEVTTSLDPVLRDADHLVLAAANTAETRHLLCEETLARVKPGVHVVNVARGALIDQDALRRALDEERVGLASLDVAEPEPVPAGHWLYTHPRVRLSAHTSWNAPGAIDRLLDPFLENLGRYLRGEALTFSVDLQQGY